VTGSVKTLVFDPEGLVMVVLKEDPDPKQQNTQTLAMEDNVCQKLPTNFYFFDVSMI